MIAKGIIREDEWTIISQDIRFDYQQDNHFAELKNNEILQQRLNALQLLDPYIGKFYSINYIRRNVLMQTEEEVKEIDKEISDEEKLMMDHAKKQGALMQQSQGEQQ